MNLLVGDLIPAHKAKHYTDAPGSHVDRNAPESPFLFRHNQSKALKIQNSSGKMGLDRNFIPFSI
jgi:hypothetical protein